MNTIRLKTWTILAVALICAGCGFTQTAEDGAITRTSESEIPGTHSPEDLDPITAQRWIDDVQVGRALDMNNRVPGTASADTFTLSDTIYVSMEVTDAPAGSAVRVTIMNRVTGESLWSREKSVPPGRSHLHFNLGARTLGAGDYRVEVVVGDEPVATRSFKVDTQNDIF